MPETVGSPRLTRTFAWSPPPEWAPPVLLAAGYYLGCLAGFALRFPDSGISFFWPPTAVLTSALVVTAPRSWGALLVGAFVAHGFAHSGNGVPMGSWPIQFLGNASQAVLAAWIIRRYSGGPRVFADFRTVLAFIVGACVFAPAVASLIPSYAYVNLGWAPDFWQAWRARAVSNAIASLTLVPTVLALWQRRLTRPTWVSWRLFEYALLLLGVIAVHVVTGSIDRRDLLRFAVALYAPAPLLLWATVRFGGAGLSFALLWTTLLTVSMTLAGQGPFAGGTPADTVVAVQLFIAANAIPMMLVAGLLEQYRAEHRALLDVEQQNSAILRALPDLMFLQTRDGVYLQCYPKRPGDAASVATTLPGRQMQDVLPPDLADAFARAFEAVAADAPSVLEYTHVIEGQPRRYEGRCIAVDDDRVLTVIRDMTDRWRSEQALRETQQRYALATSAGGIGVWDLDVRTGRVCVEGTVREILGYDQHDVGERLDDWQALIHPADRDDAMARLKSFTTGRSGSFAAEYRMIHKDGSVRWLAASGAVTDWIDGLPSRITGTYTDITDRKEAARALRDANDALVRTGRVAAFAELSASIAHELSQPLTAIAANVHACLRSLDSATPVVDVHEALEDVVAEIRRARNIVLRTQEMFANRPVQKRPMNLNDVVCRTLEIADARLRECNVLSQLDLDENLPIVLADGVQMQQVLLNLIVNGVDSMEAVTDGHRVLRISSRRSKRGAVVSVRDTGTGFEPADGRSVFEPFYTTKTAGTGMGLAISRSIVRSHGGSIWAVANIDRGATFRFRVPVPDRATQAEIVSTYTQSTRHP